MVSVGDTLPFPKEADFLASHSSYEDLPRLTTHRTISAPGRCVVVAIARNSASTSNVSCRNIDNSGNGEGEPFQLRKLENRSFWENEEVTNEGLKVGCLLEYGVVRGSCVQGEGDEEQFIFHRNAGAEPQDVDKILLDLQDDESVYGGLRKALINNISKRMVKVILEVQNMFTANNELLEELRECINPERMVKVILEVQNMFTANYELLVKMCECINPEDVDKILLDLQDDESVYGRLTKALINNILKRMGEVILAVQNMLTTFYELLVKMCECINPEDVDKILLNLQDDERVYGGLTKALINNISKRMGEVMLEVQNLFTANYELLVKMYECINLKRMGEVRLAVLNMLTTFYELVAKMCECINPEKLAKVKWNVRNLFVVYGEPLVKTREYFNSKFYRLQAYSACTRLFFTGIRAGTINNERVTLETMSGERLDMPLNCRESLVLSTGPVHLQLKRPWVVADDNVGGVAVLKYEDGKTTCEGLILKYKPYVISRDEEPVKIQNASGEMIPIHHVFGLESGKMRWKVLFDSGSEAGTGISRELLEELNLKADPEKKKEVEVIGGGSCEFETVQIDLSIRGFHFPANGLVGAVAKDTNLLVGMDVIKKLFDQGYSIGS